MFIIHDASICHLKVEHNTDWRRVCDGLPWVLEGSDPRFTLMACEFPITAFKSRVLKLRAATTGLPIDGEKLTLLGGDQAGALSDARPALNLPPFNVQFDEPEVKMNVRARTLDRHCG
jgi:hypothetical protein